MSVAAHFARTGALAVAGLLAGCLLVELGVRVWDWRHGIDHRLYLRELANSDSLALGIWAVVDDASPQGLVERAYGRYPPLQPDARVLSTTSDYTVLYRIDAHGLRDRGHDVTKPAGVTRVLAFGDSFTFGTGVAGDECFTEIAERRLGDTEVINMGVPGYGLDQMLLSFLAQGARWQPDLVAVFLNRHVAERHRTGIVEGDDVRIPKRLDTVAATGDGGHTAYLGADDPVWAADRPWLVRHSHAAALVAFRLQVRRLQKQFEAEDAKFWGRARAVNASRRLTEDRNLAQQARTLALLRAFRRAVEDAGARLLVVNIDHKVGTGFLAAEPGIDVVDLSAALAGEEAHGPLTFTYDQHYNAATHRFLGERIAEEIARRAPPSG